MIKSMFKSLLKMFLFSLVLTFGTIFFLPKIIPQEMLRTALTNYIERAAEKEVEISGDVEFSLLPNISFGLKKVILTDQYKKTKHILSDLYIDVDSLSLFNQKLPISYKFTWDTVPFSIKTVVSDLSRLMGGATSKVDVSISKPIIADLSGNVTVNNNSEIIVKEIKIGLDKTKGTGDIDFMSGVEDILGDGFKATGNFIFEVIEVDEILEIVSILNKLTNPEAVPLSKTNIKLTKAKINLHGDMGTYSATIPEMFLHGGKGSAKLVHGRDYSTTAADLTFTNINIGDLFSKTSLTGTGDFNISLSTRGVDTMVQLANLEGKGSLKLKDGAFIGADVLSMVNPRNITAAFGKNKQTKIVDLNSTFTIKKGVLKNDDLVVNIPFTKLTGAGEFNFLTQEINYRITPIVAMSELGLRVPLLIRGNIKKPRILPYIPDIINKNIDPRKLLQQIRDRLRKR